MSQNATAQIGTTSLKELLSQKLVAIAVDVTTTDKADGAEQNNISVRTVERYLRGEVFDNEIGSLLCELFYKRKQERMQRANLLGGEVAA